MPVWYVWFELPDTDDETKVQPAPDTVSVSVPARMAKDDDVKRRTVFTASAAVAVAALDARAEPWERVAHAISNPRFLDEQGCDHLRHGVADFYRQEEFLPARKLAPRLRQQISRIATILEGSHPETLRRNLLTSPRTGDRRTGAGQGPEQRDYTRLARWPRGRAVRCAKGRPCCRGGVDAGHDGVRLCAADSGAPMEELLHRQPARQYGGDHLYQPGP